VIGKENISGKRSSMFVGRRNLPFVSNELGLVRLSLREFFFWFANWTTSERDRTGEAKAN
jgi:hypothetical protein